jgi:hypothetical protein
LETEDEMSASHETVRRGGCRCGAIRYEVRGEPHKVGVCHCSDCRKETGSAFLAYADFAADALEVTGEYRTFEGRSFCPACGTALFHYDEDGAEICIGSLDDTPSGLVPTREGWIKRREPWLQPLIGASQWREDPARGT